MPTGRLTSATPAGYLAPALPAGSGRAVHVHQPVAAWPDEGDRGGAGGLAVDEDHRADRERVRATGGVEAQLGLSVGLQRAELLARVHKLQADLRCLVQQRPEPGGLERGQRDRLLVSVGIGGEAAARFVEGVELLQPLDVRGGVSADVVQGAQPGPAQAAVHPAVFAPRDELRHQLRSWIAPVQPRRGRVAGRGQRDLDRQRDVVPGAGRPARSGSSARPGVQQGREGPLPGRVAGLAGLAGPAGVRGLPLGGRRGQHERHHVLAVDPDRAAAFAALEPEPGPVRGRETCRRRVDVAVLAAHGPGQGTRRQFPQRAHDHVLACVLDAPLVGLRADGLGEGGGIDVGHHVTLHATDASQPH